MACDLELAPRTLAVFDEACEACGLDPEAVRAGETEIDLSEADPEPLLEVVTEEVVMEPGYERQMAHRAARIWFSLAMGQVARATQRAAEQAEAVGVREIMERTASTGKPLRRVLATLDASDYERVWHEWPIERSLTYLMLRSVDHVSENLEDYL